MSLTSLLVSIEDWLSHHAPQTLQELAPPAADADIDAVEGELNLALDPHVRELVKWHNGSGEAFDVAPGFFLLGLADMARSAKRRADAVSAAYPAWNRLWLPIASDGCGAHLVVDQADGHVLLSDPEDGMAVRETWPSTHELLATTFAAMRDGQELMDSRCFVEDGRVFWDAA